MNIGASRKAIAAAILAVGFCSAHALAQEEVGGTPDLNATLRDAYQNVDQMEIRVDGAVGTFVGDQLYFVDDSGRYKVKLDAGRDVRRQIEGCEVNVFDPDSSACKFVGMAEVAIDESDDNLGDGFEIELILYKMESFERSDR